MPRHFSFLVEGDTKESFPRLRDWLSSEELHKIIIKMQREGRFRNERTVQALIWSYLEQKYFEGDFYFDYQFDVEIYSEDEGYPDLSLCEKMDNERYMEAKRTREFNDSVLVWIELKYYPTITNAENVRSDLEAISKM